MVSNDAPLPTGFEGAERDLIRLDAPDGSAVAWIAPSMGANVIGFAVRGRAGWRQILFSQGPAQLAEMPSRFGVPILFPFPGHMLGGRYTWRGHTYVMPLQNPDAKSFTHGFAQWRPWRVEKTGGSEARGDFFTGTDLDPAHRAGYPFDVRLVLDVRVEPNTLVVALTAQNEDTREAPFALGLHPYFGSGVYGPDRSRATVTLPGRAERVMSPGPPVPTGEQTPPTEPVRIVPLGRSMHVARTDFGADRVATIQAPDDGPRVRLEMDAGYRDLLFYAPEMHDSISLEPHTHAPGAASLPEGDPDGLQGFELGETLRATMTIRAENA
jgi:aldose 1-epimerase